MKFDHAVDLYLSDQRAFGRITSDRTVVAYRSRLLAHAEDVKNRDPRTIGREDIKRTLARWEHPNTRRHAHAVLAAFYDWTMEEGYRKDNPARQVRRAKKRQTSVYRLTRSEVVRLFAACHTQRERWAIRLGAAAGLRRDELRFLRREHLARPGWVHVSHDIAKGGHERWVPVGPDLEDVVAEILEHREPGQHVIAARQVIDPPKNTKWREDANRAASPQAIWRLVSEVAKRAGIHAHIHPHLLRHAYGDHIAKHAGLRAAQHLLGHVDVSTTAGTYVGKPSLDELAVSVHGLSYDGYPPSPRPANPVEATTGIEPVETNFGLPTGFLEGVGSNVGLYVSHFKELADA